MRDNLESVIVSRSLKLIGFHISLNFCELFSSNYIILIIQLRKHIFLFEIFIEKHKHYVKGYFILLIVKICMICTWYYNE